MLSCLRRMCSPVPRPRLPPRTSNWSLRSTAPGPPATLSALGLDQAEPWPLLGSWEARHSRETGLGIQGRPSPKGFTQPPARLRDDASVDCRRQSMAGRPRLRHGRQQGDEGAQPNNSSATSGLFQALPRASLPRAGTLHAAPGTHMPQSRKDLGQPQDPGKSRLPGLLRLTLLWPRCLLLGVKDEGSLGQKVQLCQPAATRQPCSRGRIMSLCLAANQHELGTADGGDTGSC